MARIPQKKSEHPHRLDFSANSLRNTTIAVDNDALYYEVVTRYWHPHLTKLNKLNPDTREMLTIAELERMPGREPRLRFGLDDANWVPVKDWLKIDRSKQGGVFTGGAGVQYRWKTHKRKWQLIRADTEDKSPLVKHHQHKRHFFVLRMSRHAYLEIKPEVVETLDTLIMSFLLVERRRRDTTVRIHYW